MKTTDVKRKRKLARTHRRADMTDSYRRFCKAEIARMRQQRAPTDEFRSTLKQLRHRFTRAIAGRGGLS